MIASASLTSLAEPTFAADARGWLTSAAPRLHILRAADEVVCRCHADLADDIAGVLARIATRPRGRPTDWARDYADYANILGPTGPLYGFPDALADGDGAVRIDPTNADLLRGGFDDRLPDVVAGMPIVAVVVDGRAVSLCASVRIRRRPNAPAWKPCRTIGAEAWMCGL